MEKQACHVEWGRLKLTGGAVMTGAAIGSSQLMRVACRTSPYLVHLFEDSNLVSIWRFPADPIFLLFGPSFHQINAQDIVEKEEETVSSDCSLLAITSDGRVWLLNCRKEYDPSTERLTKKQKEAVPEELQTAVQEVLVNENGIKPQYGEMSSQSNLRDNPEDVLIHESQIPGSFVRNGGLIKRAEHNTSETEECDVDPWTSKKLTNETLISKWKKVSSDTFPRFDNKIKVKVVSQEALLSCVPGTSVAAFGPNDSVALLGVSGALKVVRVGSIDLPKKSSTELDTYNINDVPTDNSESGCLLFASISVQSNADEQPEGHVASLDAGFFQNLFGYTDNITSVCGILHGDTKGHLYTSLISPELTPFHTRLLCDFGQPIVGALVVPATTTSKMKDNLRFEVSSSSKHHGSSLLIIGLLGKVILITGSKETVVQTDDGLFWPTSRRFSWRCKNNTVTARQLNEQNLAFCEWEVFSPITFACMLGPHRLCYCTRSEIFYADLIENVDVAQIYHHYSKTKQSTSAKPKDSVSLSLVKLSQKLQSSGSQELKEKRLFTKELLSQRVSLADVVVGIAGRGVFGGNGSSRPLVALTTRGRLLGVEVSNNLSSRALSIAADIPKSWRSLLSRMEEKIQGLLQVVEELAQSTYVIKNHGATITLALNELAIALPLANEICLYELRTRRPDTSLLGEPPPGKLSSFLTVTDHTPVHTSPEHLVFRQGIANFVPLTSFHSRKVKIAIRVCNQSRWILSPYWSLLLELRSVSSDQSMHFSLPINGGLGLPVGADYTHEFIAQLPGKGLGPVLVYVFLCHHHHSHHLIAKDEPHLFTSDKGFPPTKKNELCSRLIDASPSKFESILKSPGADQIRPLEYSQTSGAVCIVLSQYRIDLLSILQTTPPHLGIDTRVHLRSTEKHSNLDVSSGNHFNMRFSSKILLNCVMNTPYVSSKDTGKLWQDLYLDDLLRGGSVSKTGQKILLSAYDSQTFSISLHSDTTGKNCTVVEVLLETSSLLLGSYVREALMWRLDHSKGRFVLKEFCPWQQPENVKTANLLCNSIPDAHCYDDTNINRSEERSQGGYEDALAQTKPSKIIDVVVELDERLAIIFEMWGNILRSPEMVQFDSLLKETFAALQDVMLVYRTCRADKP